MFLHFLESACQKRIRHSKNRPFWLSVFFNITHPTVAPLNFWSRAAKSFHARPEKLPRVRRNVWFCATWRQNASHVLGWKFTPSPKFTPCYDFFPSRKSMRGGLLHQSVGIIPHLSSCTPSSLSPQIRL